MTRNEASKTVAMTYKETAKSILGAKEPNSKPLGPKNTNDIIKA